MPKGQGPMGIWSEFSSKWTPAVIVPYPSCSQQGQLSLWVGPIQHTEKAYQCSSRVSIFPLSFLHDSLPECLGDRGAKVKFIFGHLVFCISGNLGSYSLVYINGLLLILSLSSFLLSFPFSLSLYYLCCFGKEEICLLQKCMLIKQIIRHNLLLKVSVL